MISDSNLQKILELLNQIENLDNYPELLESFDQLIDLHENEDDFFFVPEEANLQLPEIFLKDAKLKEIDKLSNQNVDANISQNINKNCAKILEYLETVELPEIQDVKKKKAPEPNIELLKKMIKLFV